MSLTEDTVVVAIDEHVSSELADEEVVLQTETGTYYGLNPVGQYVWELLDEPRRAGDLPELVAREYDTTASECRSDVFAFVNDLLDAELVEIPTDDES